MLKDLLVQRQSCVELYVGNSSSWKLQKRGSPGNLQAFEDMVEIKESAPALALMLATGATNTVGVAFAENGGNTIYTSEFVDDDQFSNLETLLVQNGVKEVLHCAKGHPAWGKIYKVLERVNCVVTERKRAEFAPADVEQDLKRLLGSTFGNLPQLEQKAVMSSTAALIRYFDLMSDDANTARFKMKQYNLSDFMRLDSAVVRALNLMPNPQEVSQNRSSSLYGLLNQCKTAMGSRLLNMWIKQPLLDIRQIKTRHDLVEAFVEDMDVRDGVREHSLRRVSDIRKYVKKLQRGTPSIKDMVELYDTVHKLPTIINLLNQYQGPHQSLLSEHFIENLEQHRANTTKYASMVEAAVDMEAVAGNRYLVNSSFDDQLKDLKEEMDHAEESIATHVAEVTKALRLKEKDVKTVEKDDQNHRGWVFRITKANEKAIRGKSQYDVIQAAAGGVIFVTSEMRQFSKQFTKAKEQYYVSQKDLVENIQGVASTYAPVFELLEETIAELDVLLSFAHTSVNAPTPYTRPKMLPKGEGVIDLVNARHPCVEVVQGDSGQPFIANNVHLRRDGASSREDGGGAGGDAGLLQIITGPNMGGKSTYIRQVGVILLMAQVGCFVPADEAELAVVDCILARVGAGDSQLRGVSTFMAEMLETAAILRTATPNSFIIIDELGRGTSTYDGFGLAWAIAEHLATNVRAPCLFATHFHELTALANKLPDVVKNRHVTAMTTAGDITFLYKLAPGPCDQSFGIHVAELAKFPPQVVEMAKRKAGELEDFGSSAGTNGATPGSAQKRQKTMTEGVEELSAADKEANAKVVEYLKEFAQMPMEGAGASAAIGAMKKKIESEPNAILRELMAVD
jgi:DNA mismatch repair protein MSH2